jgi:hypothetical protein
VQPQQPYATDHSPRGSQIHLGSTRSASPVAIAFGVVGVLLVTLTPVEWVADMCGLVAMIAGLIGQRRPGAGVKFISWGGATLGLVTLAISVSS